jgi:hypothetical protein
VLSQFSAQEQAGSEGDTVRKIFAAADAQFAAAPPAPEDLPVLLPEVEAVLKKLEERL